MIIIEWLQAVAASVREAIRQQQRWQAQAERLHRMQDQADAAARLIGLPDRWHAYAALDLDEFHGALERRFRRWRKVLREEES